MDNYVRKQIHSLVEEFAVALEAKLLKAEVKYNWNGGWESQYYTEGQMQEDLLNHVQKGDPLDVAAYSAFAWKRKWRTLPENQSIRIVTVVKEDKDEGFDSRSGVSETLSEV